MLRTFVSTGFQGHWPVGTSAVIAAESEEQARELLVTYLRDTFGDSAELDFELREWAPKGPTCCILQDGNY